MKDLILPDPLAEHYELVSCLKYSEQASTCLIAVRSSGKTVLLKTASDHLLSKSLLQEKMVLEMIHQTDSPFAASFPRPILLEWYGETCFYIRSYIEGKSLEELCESNYERPGFAEPTALEYLIELTEILHFMHTLTPSLLHRDIGTSNPRTSSWTALENAISSTLASPASSIPQRQAIRWSWEPGLPLRRSSSATSRRIFEATFIPWESCFSTASPESTNRKMRFLWSSASRSARSSPKPRCSTPTNDIRPRRNCFRIF